MTSNFHPSHLKIDERNHVEKPFLDQLAGLGWEIIDQDNKQHPCATYRRTFTEVVMLPVLRGSEKVEVRIKRSFVPILNLNLQQIGKMIKVLEITK